MWKLQTYNVVIIGVMLLIPMMPVVFPETLGSTDDLVFDFSFNNPCLSKIMIKGNIYDCVTIDGLMMANDYQEPRLPIQPVNILLPQGKTVASVEVSSSEIMVLGDGFHVEVGGRVIPLINTDMILEDYGSSQVQITGSSSGLAEVVGVHVCRGFRILQVNLCPVQYDGDTGKLVFHEQIHLRVHTTSVGVHPVFRGSQTDVEVVEHMIDNPTILTTYTADIKTTTKKIDAADYVIITSNRFVTIPGVYSFQNLLASKQSKGLTGQIVTIETIISNPDYQVNGKWGDNNLENPFYQRDVSTALSLFDDTAARIRNFIRYAYTELGTDYVLLAGDADVIKEEDNILPLRGLFANESGLPLSGLMAEEEDDIPSDVYYACLDGCFNFDLDEHYGECKARNDLDKGVDEADLYSEVWVGRTCIDSKTEAQNFVKKTLWYDDLGNDPYLAEILFVGEFLGNDFYFPYGGMYKDLTEPFVPSQYRVNKFYDNENYEWYPDELLQYLYNHPAQMINHDGHGNVDYIFKTGSDFIRTFENTQLFFLYSHSCLTGSFDNYNCWSGHQEDDCVAEVLTCELEYGAYACILNARFGLGSEHTSESPSGAYDESFYKALFTENIKHLGAASHYSKEDNVWRIDENGMRWCYYQTNLFGDPELSIKDPNNAPEKPALSGPTSGQKGVSYEYTARSVDHQGKQLLYWFEWGDGSNSGWVGFYDSGQSVIVSHIWNFRGSFEVKVRAKNTDEVQSEWSDPLPIIIPKTYEHPFQQFIEKLFEWFLNTVFRVNI